ncbi:hypothetical protein [Acaryochloris marina]|uniref:hypothetical protein n=1 Tax=Acaryochloris marina TaxID=155978 RepID=UPI0011D119DA|nr:hypothetical protein [Acaryochloris marina]
MTDDGAVPADHFWFATNNEVQLTADNPIELLGLAAIYDRKKPVADEPYWWVVEGNDIWDELYENAWGPFGDD